MSRDSAAQFIVTAVILTYSIAVKTKNDQTSLLRTSQGRGKLSLPTSQRGSLRRAPAGSWNHAGRYGDLIPLSRLSGKSGRGSAAFPCGKPTAFRVAWF